ncbi:hypothetical protein L1987_30560 [Smallanthus sonchifolius]|uniref:Uncharacterized protein n=1 Tax=Smallanthus sonchifolius TaxID=185202 RepID=A0ACB9I4C2_9ASTR|nr:hypothetical protein L1987_30560 [Smallanthus sonchifolius]
MEAAMPHAATHVPRLRQGHRPRRSLHPIHVPWPSGLSAPSDTLSLATVAHHNRGCRCPSPSSRHPSPSSLSLSFSLFLSATPRQPKSGHHLGSICRGLPPHTSTKSLSTLATTVALTVITIVDTDDNRNSSLKAPC